MKNILQEFENSNFNITNHEILQQYIYFCKNNNLKTKQSGSALHHILPAKIYPEYKDLRRNKWNGVHLSFKDHYIAHSMLAEAINHPSIIGAWWGMNNRDKDTKGIDGLEIIGAEKYSELFNQAQEEQSKRMKGKVTCRLISNPEETIIVSKKEYDKNRHLYLANTEGKFSVIEIATNKKIFINKEDYNKEFHFFHKTGSVRKQSSIEKEKITKSAIGKDGLNVSQRAGRKGWETIKETYTEEQLKSYNNSKAKHKEKHNLALKINIYNSKGEIQYECNGNIKDVILENNLPDSLIESYRKNRKIGVAANAITRMINKGQEKYLGWYATKIK